MKLPFVFARRYVAGGNFEQAAPKGKSLNQKKINATLDLLGENARDKEIRKDWYESQMLYGLREKTMTQLAEKSHKARIYVS